MTLESQVCSLELAKKLKELGVKQESVWFWAKQPASTGFWTIFYFNNTRGDRNKFSAFTVAELGEMLPRQAYSIHDNTWGCYFKKKSVEADTEADARAKMLIYLIETNLISL